MPKKQSSQPARRIPRGVFPRSLNLVIAAATFLIIIALSVPLIWLLIALLGRFSDKSLPEFAFGPLLGLAIVAGVVGAHYVYTRLHWRVLPSGSQLCNCGYDLTGNVSGICPECGTPIGGNRPN